jgi:hypothetical protein
LHNRSGILGRNEVEEAADGGKPAVARADGATSLVFGVTEERDDLAGGQVG